MDTYQCPKCAYPVIADQNDRFVRCGHCENTLFFDSGGILVTYILPFVLPESEARDIFMRWTAGPEMAADLEKGVTIRSISRHFFPLYRFRIDRGGTQEVITRPARVSTLPGMSGLRVPAGKLKEFHSDADFAGAERLNPDIPLAPSLTGPGGDVKEQSLIFVPVFTVVYEYQGNSFIVVIDGSAGTVHPGVYPVRSSRPYGTVMASGIILGFLGAVAGLILSPVLSVLLVAGFIGAFAGGYRVAKAR